MTEDRFASRRREGMWRRMRGRLYAALALLVAVVLVWVVWFSSILGVQHVDVTGMKTLKADDIVAKAAAPHGRPLARVNTSAIEARVAAMERVESVDVRRRWPNTISIDVIERHAVAWIRIGSQIRGLDRFGVDFSAYSKPPKGLLEIRATAPTEEKLHQSLVEAAQVIGTISKDDAVLERSIRYVTAGSKDSVELVLSKNRVVGWGSAAHSKQKLKVLAPLLKIKARTYDVSAPSQPTTKQ